MYVVDNHIRKFGVQSPKIKIKSFDGKAMNWKPFLEAFNATKEIYIFKMVFKWTRFTVHRGNALYK